MDLVEADVSEVLAPTTLADAPIVRCSAVSGAGMDTLREALDTALDGLPSMSRILAGRGCLSIGSFTVSGFGTVATGTLVDGRLSSGDQVAIEPGGRSARIRGLQSHKKSVDKAQPGTRTAVNLSPASHRRNCRAE